MNSERTGAFSSKFNQPRFPDKGEGDMSYADDEPPPEDNGRIVVDELVKWLRDQHFDEAIVMVSERAARGFEEYGQYLHTDDGRDGLRDLVQELADALQYAYKLKMNGRLDEEVVGEKVRCVLEPLVELFGFELVRAGKG